MKNLSKVFWHITPTSNLDHILRDGIKQSEDGQFGDGVYCIEENDLNSLQVLLNADWYKDNGIQFEDLSIVEFIYNGNYKTYIPEITGYRDEKWILIEENINFDKIIKTIDSKEYKILEMGK